MIAEMSEEGNLELRTASTNQTKKRRIESCTGEILSPGKVRFVLFWFDSCPAVAVPDRYELNASTT
jgi:hypothetical protein